MQVVLLIGIQGAGKTTFYQQRFLATHLRLSLDLVRTRHRERVLFETCLELRQSCVIDNTNVRRRERARYIEPARAAHARVVGYFFEPQVRASLSRNQQRVGRARIPGKGLVGTYKRLARPTLAEGFDELFCVRAGPGHQFFVSEWAVAGRRRLPSEEQRR
jgi:predicted kinase